MSKLAITTISIALLTASSFAASGLAQANGHEDPQAAIEKLQQEKSVLLKRLNNAVAYSKSRGMQIKELQSKNVAMSNGISSSLNVSRNRSAQLAEARAMAESEQSKSKALAERLRNAIAVSKSRRAQLAESQAAADSEQNKSKTLAKRLRNAIAVSKSRRTVADSEQSKNKILSKRLRNAIAVSKSRRTVADSEQSKNKVLAKRLRNAIAVSKSRKLQLAKLQDDWAANTGASLNAAFGGVQGTLVSTNSDKSVTIQVGNNGLFNTGGTILSANGSQLLSTISQEISVTDANIVVVGHTDNIPVGNSNRFANNEALSFARALSTLEFLRDQGIATERLSAAGYGAQSPIASNDTAEGRRQNRRVEIILRK